MESLLTFELYQEELNKHDYLSINKINAIKLRKFLSINKIPSEILNKTLTTFKRL